MQVQLKYFKANVLLDFVYIVFLDLWLDLLILMTIVSKDQPVYHSRLLSMGRFDLYHEPNGIANPSEISIK